MALTRWEPFGGLPSLRREMDRLFDDFFSKSPFQLASGSEDGPAVEISDTKDTVMVRAQIPGISKENVQVTVTDNTLTLKGEFKEEKKKEDKNYYRREFRYGSFVRTLPLPAAVQSDKAKAHLKDGVLEITIPKSEPAKVKEIPVQA